MILKPFKIELTGLFCEVPHPERRMELFVDSHDKDNLITDIDVLVICNEVCCNIRNKLQLRMKPSEVKEQESKFNQYHFGKVTDKSKTRKINLVLEGIYCEEHDEKRYINVKHEQLTEGQIVLLLYDICCNMRNKMYESKAMSREQLMEIAEEFKIYNLGMAKGEPPFIL